ncbi:hypothetical protein CY652_04085 [Burkholderia sp. WAC0059]|uniref:oligosaccharide flippase family protein n=1 Tax=Burkholderia sp. WAC0059 TaxID=2066022 RepID=UPI000C7F57F5|nr:oligosaccharide flippase family protein [Burkholderia sp. WAC0059]PLZ03578.1 hypothetical protein CY652_04085 [Burkholderia sp. WAC0059]
MSTKKDALALYVVQACGYLVPLVSLPYLSRMLGPDRLGVIGFAQAFTQFFVMLTDFGFDLTTARSISLNRHEPQAVARLYWTVTLTKAAFASLCVAFILLLLWLVPALHDDRLAICSGFLWLAGTVVTPQWLYQGLEKMPLVAVLGLFARVACLVPVFCFVDGPGDYLIAAVSLSSSMLVSGTLLTLIAFRSGMVASWHPVSLRDVRAQLADAFQIFSGSALTFVYTYANAVILKFLVGNTAVGYYMTAEKLINPLRQLFSPLIQAIYPKLCVLHAEGRSQQAQSILRWLVLAILAVNAVAVIVVYAGGATLIAVFFGAKFEPALPVLKALIFLPPVVGLATVFLQLELAAQGAFGALKRIYAAGALFHVAQSVWLVMHFGATGTAVSVILTETFVTALIYLECRLLRGRRRFA